MTEDGLSPDTLAALDALVTETEAPSEAEHEVETSASADETEKPETETEADPEGDKPDGEDEATDEDEPEEPKKKKLSGSERLKRRNAALEAELAELRAARSQPQGDGGDVLEHAVRTEIGAEPKEEDYKGDYLAFESDRNAWKAARLALIPQLRREMQARTRAAQEAQYETIEEHRERLDDLEKALPGSKAKLAQAAKSGINPDDRVARLILSSEKSAHLAVHLADKPELVAELNLLAKSDPERLGFRLGNIAARLSLPKPKTATSAPPPVQPVKGSARASFNPDKASVSDLAKHLGIRG